MHWHSVSIEEALKETGSSEQGLTNEAAKEKLSEHGRNELVAKKKKNRWLFFSTNFLML